MLVPALGVKELLVPAFGVLGQVQAYAAELAALANDARDLGVVEAAHRLGWLLRHGLIDPDTPADQVFPDLFAAVREDLAQEER